MKLSTVLLLVGVAGAAYMLHKRGVFSRIKQAGGSLAGTVGEGTLIDASAWSVTQSPPIRAEQAAS